MLVLPPEGKVTGMPLDATTKQRFLEVFVTAGKEEAAYRTSDRAIEAMRETACMMNKALMLEVDQQKNIVKAVLERLV